MFRAVTAVAVAGVGLAVTASAQVVTVTTADDTVDFGGQQRIADLPGPDGRVSLPEAGLASDNTPGVQTIAFAIPRNEWEYQWLFPGRAVLRPFLGFRIFQPAVLDATTQTAFTGDTNPDGGEVVIWQETYIIDTVGSVVRGFDNSSFHLSGGSNNTVQGNTLSNIEVFDSDGNLIGGAGPGEGNTGGTIKIDRSSDNMIFGNTVTRVRILGWFGGGQPAVGNRVGGPGPGERNFITGYGTWGEEGGPGGTTVHVFDSRDTVIENNWIGTTPDGMAQGSLASTSGIGFEGENYGALILNNRIAGILGHGIDHWDGFLFGSAITLYGTGGDITIRGNTIGLNAAGEPALGSVTGIMSYDYYLGAVRGVTIGGPNPGDGNEIAGHLTSGITVANPLSSVIVSGNSIHDNAGIGIDLVGPGFQYGVTLNDPLDADTGGNHLQNFPVLLEAESAASTTRVRGTLNSAPSEEYIVEFFASAACDGSGHGEGEVFLGRAEVASDGAGTAEFEVVLPVGGSAGRVLTATATHEATGDTSEFSACAAISAWCPADFDGDGFLTGLDFDAYVAAFEAGESSSDFDSDGFVTGLDFDAYVEAFEAGC